jgi:hypothetical protein
MRRVLPWVNLPPISRMACEMGASSQIRYEYLQANFTHRAQISARDGR